MIVAAFSVGLLVLSIPLIAQLRSLDTDRAARRRTVAATIGATGTRVVYSILVVVAYAILPMAWALAAIPTGGLAPFLSAPLAMRLGDIVSHRAGAELTRAIREAAALVVVFAALYAAGGALFP